MKSGPYLPGSCSLVGKIAAVNKYIQIKPPGVYLQYSSRLRAQMLEPKCPGLNSSLSTAWPGASGLMTTSLFADLPGRAAVRVK